MEPGTLVGSYRIVKPIGRGSSSTVFLALDERYNQLVSFKILSVNPKPETLARFDRGARLWKALKHGNIAECLDHGQTPEGRAYTIIEFVDGQGLDQLIYSEGKVPRSRLDPLFEQLLKALDFAHETGVLHRDIKPSNVLITAAQGGETVKLIDFGLARETRSPSSPGNAGITAAGHVVGTPRYISPEQVSGTGAGVGSDVYSAALVYYELLTGKPAISSVNIAETLRRHTSSTPTISADDPALPESLAHILSKATERRVEDRYTSAAAFLDAFKLARAPLFGAPGTNPSSPLPLEPASNPYKLAREMGASKKLNLSEDPFGLKKGARAGVAPDLHLKRSAPRPGINQPIQVPESIADHIPDAGQRPPDEVQDVVLGTTTNWFARGLRLFVIFILIYSVSVGVFWISQDLVLFRSHTVKIRDARTITSTLKWEKVSITGANGHQLVGYFGKVRKGKSKGTLLYLHGLDSRPEVEGVQIDPLRDHGLNVLVLAQRGYSGSEGSSDAASFHKDALKAYDWIIGTRGVKPLRVFVYGRGVGGAVAAFVSRKRKVAALIIEGTSPSLAQRMTEVLPIVPFDKLLHRDFDLRPITKTRRPVLFLYGGQDMVAPPEKIDGLYRRIKAKKSIRKIDGAGHDGLSSERGKEYRKAIVGFIDAFAD